LGVLEAITPLAVFPQRILWMDALSGEESRRWISGRRFANATATATS